MSRLWLPRRRALGPRRTKYAMVHKSHIGNTLALILSIYVCDPALTPHEAFWWVKAYQKQNREACGPKRTISCGEWAQFVTDGIKAEDGSVYRWGSMSRVWLPYRRALGLTRTEYAVVHKSYIGNILV